MPPSMPQPGDHFVAAHVSAPLTVGELHLSARLVDGRTREHLITAEDGTRWVLRDLAPATVPDEQPEIRWLGFPAPVPSAHSAR